MPENRGEKEANTGAFERFRLSLSTLCVPLFFGYSGHRATVCAVVRMRGWGGYAKFIADSFGPISVNH